MFDYLDDEKQKETEKLYLSRITELELEMASVRELLKLKINA